MSAIVGSRIQGELKEHDSFDEMGYDLRLVHNHGDCFSKVYGQFKRIHEIDREVLDWEIDRDNPTTCDACGKGILVPSYEEVQQWWDNSDYYMSTYPPSAWLKYLEREGLGMSALVDNPGKIEDGVAEMVSEGDGRGCDCQWSHHESDCTWSPHPGHTGKWNSMGERWICDTPDCDSQSWYV